MIFPGSLMAMVKMAELHAELAKFERKRWESLTPEQRTEELRVREVEALERLARAQERAAEKKTTFSIF